MDLIQFKLLIQWAIQFLSLIFNCYIIYHINDITTKYLSNNNIKQLLTFVLLPLLLVFERITVFKSLNNLKNKINKIDNLDTNFLKGFVYTLLSGSYTEHLVFNKAKAINKFVSEQHILNQSLISLLVTYIPFTFCCIYTILALYPFDSETNNTALIALSLNLIQCVFALGNYYHVRIQHFGILKSKNHIQFNALPQKTKEILLNPLQFQGFKLFELDLVQQNELLLEQFQEKYKKQQFQKQKSQVLDKSCQQEENNINCFQRMHIWLYCLACVSMFFFLSVLFTLMTVSEFNIYATVILIPGLIFALPQTVQYCSLKFEEINHKEKINQRKLKSLEIFYLVVKFPLIILIALIDNFSPNINQQIPFVKGTRETWISNYFNGLWSYNLKLGTYIYCIFHLYQIFEEEKDYNGFELNDFQKQMILDKDSVYYKIFNICLVLLLLLVIYDIMHITDFFLSRNDKNQQGKNDINLELNLQESQMDNKNTKISSSIPLKGSARKLLQSSKTTQDINPSQKIGTSRFQSTDLATTNKKLVSSRATTHHDGNIQRSIIQQQQQKSILISQQQPQKSILLSQQQQSNKQQLSQNLSSENICLSKGNIQSGQSQFMFLEEADVQSNYDISFTMKDLEFQHQVFPKSYKTPHNITISELKLLQ